MTHNTKIAHLIVEGMSASAEASLLKWLIQRKPELPLETDEAPPLGQAEEWWLEKLMSGDVLPGQGWANSLPCESLSEDYITQLKRHDITVRGSATAMGRFLKKVGAVEKDKPSRKIEIVVRAGEPGGEHLQPGTTVKTKARRRHYEFYDLDACRRAFDARYGAQNWPGADGAQKGAGQSPDEE